MASDNGDVRVIVQKQYNDAVALVGQLTSALDDLDFIDENTEDIKVTGIDKRVAAVRDKVPTGIPEDWKGDVTSADNGRSI